MGLVGLDAEVMQLDLRLGPRQGRRPLERRRIAVLVGQREHRSREWAPSVAKTTCAVVARPDPHAREG